MATPLYKDKFDLLAVDAALSHRQQETMEMIATHHQDDTGFVSGVAFPNFSDGDGIGASVGQVLVFSPTAKVKAVDFGPNVFAATVMAKINGMVGGLTDENVNAHLEDIGSAAPVFAVGKLAPSLETRDPVTYIDKTEWDAELGSTGRAGIAKSTNGRDNTYWVVVHAAPDELSAGIKTMVRNSDMTYKEFIDSPVVSHAKACALRNAQRIANTIRRKCQLKVGLPMPDAGSVRGDYQLPPNVLHCDKHMYTSSVGEVVYNGTPCVAVYNDVVPASDCKESLLVSQGVWGGYALFDTKGSKSVLGYPATTKVTRHPSAVEITAEDRAVLKARSPYFTWTKKPVDSSNFDSVSGLPATLLDNNENIDAKFVRKLGLVDQTPIAVMLPIAVKISSPADARVMH